LRDVSEPFVSHGSYHILSDSHVIGWHPYYDKHLSTQAAPKDDDDSPLE